MNNKYLKYVLIGVGSILWILLIGTAIIAFLVHTEYKGDPSINDKNNSTVTTTVTTTSLSSNKTTYTSKDNVFSFNYDTEYWERDRSNANIEIQLVDKSAKSITADNFSVSSLGNQKLGDLFKDVDEYIEFFSKNPNVKNFNLLSKEKVTIDGLESAKITYTATLNGINVGQVQYTIYKNNTIITITFSTTPDKLTSGASFTEFNKVITSFKLL